MTKFYDIFKNVIGKAYMKSHTVQYERLRDRVVHTHRTSYRSGWPIGFRELNPKASLMKIYFPLSGFQSSLQIIYFRYGPDTCFY